MPLAEDLWKGRSFLATQSWCPLGAQMGRQNGPHISGGWDWNSKPKRPKNPIQNLHHVVLEQAGLHVRVCVGVCVMHDFAHGTHVRAGVEMQ